MKCISSVHYFVLVNGLTRRQIFPTRGLKQGDPLSPYLFLSRGEWLSSLINSFEATGVIHGLDISKWGFRLNHLLFTNDCLLFCQASNKEWGNLCLLLDQYKKALGQTLNLQKSFFFFNSNTSPDIQKQILEASGARKSEDYEKYLESLSMVCKSRFKTFKPLKKRTWKRIHNWKNTFLSQVGKEMLIKVVI